MTSYQVMDMTKSLGLVADYIRMLKVCEYITEFSWNAQVDDLPESVNVSFPKKKSEYLSRA